MTRSPERDRSARERAREAIVAAAFEVIGERGYHDASIAEITRRAGVARGLAHYHFGGKEQLVGAVLDRWFAENLALVRSDAGADERLAGFIDAVLASAVDDLPRQRLLLSMAVQPSTAPIVAEAERRNLGLVEGFEDALRELFAERGAADPVLEEIMLRSLLEGVIAKIAIYGDGYPVPAARRWLHRVYGLPEPAEIPSAPVELRLRASRDESADAPASAEPATPAARPPRASR